MDCHDQNIPLKTSSSGFKGCSGALIELATGEMPAGDKVSSSSIDFFVAFFVLLLKLKTLNFTD